MLGRQNFRRFDFSAQSIIMPLLSEDCKVDLLYRFGTNQNVLRYVVATPTRWEYDAIECIPGMKRVKLRFRGKSRFSWFLQTPPTTASLLHMFRHVVTIGGPRSRILSVVCIIESQAPSSTRQMARRSTDSFSPDTCQSKCATHRLREVPSVY